MTRDLITGIFGNSNLYLDTSSLKYARAHQSVPQLMSDSIAMMLGVELQFELNSSWDWRSNEI